MKNMIFGSYFQKKIIWVGVNEQIMFAALEINENEGYFRIF